MSSAHREKDEPAIELSKDGSSRLSTPGTAVQSAEAVDTAIQPVAKGPKEGNDLSEATSSGSSEKPAIKKGPPKMPSAEDTHPKWKIAILLCLLLICMFLVALDRSVIATVRLPLVYQHSSIEADRLSLGYTPNHGRIPLCWGHWLVRKFLSAHLLWVSATVWESLHIFRHPDCLSVQSTAL